MYQTVTTARALHRNGPGLLKRRTRISLFAAIAALGMLTVSVPAFAHCDSMDGPVVEDAQRAIAARDVTPVLKWVTQQDEVEIRSAFQSTLAVRGESQAARELADRFFFETLVRVHRAGEGEGFTGLKPAGSVDPAIAAADAALANGQVGPLAEILSSAVRHGVEERFAHALEKRRAAEASVEQGREYVAAYVQFTHFAEGVQHLTEAGASHQHRETQGGH